MKEEVNSIVEIESHQESDFVHAEKISGLRRAAYYTLFSFGVLAIINEVPVTKFCLDASSDALNKISSVLLKNETSIPNTVIFPIVLPPILLNGLGEILSINPIDGAMSTLNIGKSHDGKLYLIKEETVEGDNPNSFLRKNLNSLLFKGIPTIAMVLNFGIGSFATVLTINEAFEALPLLKYSLSSISFIGGLGFYVLFSYKDVLKSFNQFKNLSQSPIGLLFSHSKGMSLMPLTRFIVALSRDASIYNYVAIKAGSDLFNLPQYQTLFSVLAISSSIVVSFGTRLIPGFETYLEPFKVGENRYDLTLFNEGGLNDFYSQLNIKEKVALIAKCLPLSLIRGVGLGFLLHQGFYSLLHNRAGLREDYTQIITIPASLITSLGLALHSFRFDFDIALNARKRDFLKNANGLEPENEAPQAPSFLSFIINLGCQITSGFFGIASIMALFSPILGDEAAAILGIYIALEKGWINFSYYQPKIGDRISKIWNNLPSFSSCFNFFQKPNPQESFKSNDHVEENTHTTLISSV